MSSSSGGATSGRPPQIGRNSINMPGFNDFDIRVSRDVPIHECIKLQFTADAFNLLNHQIITGVNSTYTTFLAPGGTSRSVRTAMRTAGMLLCSTGFLGQTGCLFPEQRDGALGLRGT